ncbi:MAG TPA: hypothetical protein VIK91_23420 [Nannocystis sp.]
MTTTLALLVTISTISSPTPASSATCDASDLRCIARTNEREARELAADPSLAAERLAAASAAYLGLFRETGDKAHLCTARKLIARGLRLGHLQAVLARYRDEAAAELARLGESCEQAPRSGAGKPRVTAAKRSGVADTSEHVPDQPPATTTSDLPDAAAVKPADDLLDVGKTRPSPAPADSSYSQPALERPTPQPDAPVASFVASESSFKPGHDVTRQEGRPFFIAGGVLLGIGAAFGGVATGAGTHAQQVAARQNALASGAHAVGFSTPETAARSQALAAEIAQWRTVMIGTAITSAAIGAAAIGLLVTGGVKRHRATRVAVWPGGTGLLLHARF